MGLADLLDEPRHLTGPDTEQCSAAENPVEWAALTVGWSRVVGAAKTIQSRPAEDSKDAVLSMCADDVTLPRTNGGHHFSAGDALGG